MIIWLLALSAAQDLPPSAIPPSSSKLAYIYKTCLESKALDLEPSNADFDDIFEASKTKCAKEWVDAMTALEADFSKRPESTTGKSPQTIAIDLLSRIEDGAKDESRVAVLDRRASRNR